MKMTLKEWAETLGYVPKKLKLRLHQAGIVTYPGRKFTQAQIQHALRWEKPLADAQLKVLRARNELKALQLEILKSRTIKRSELPGFMANLGLQMFEPPQ